MKPLAAADEAAKFWVWGDAAEAPRLLHSMFRVRDIDASLRFYRDGMGMALLDRFDFEAGRFSILFLSFGTYQDAPAIELTYNWDVELPYDQGSAYGHIALGVPDVAEILARLEVNGGVIARQPYRLVDNGPILAFVKDPDGYSIELIQTKREEAVG